MQTTPEPPQASEPDVASTSENSEMEKAKFGPDDWSIFGINLWDSMETVISVLGEPESRKTVYNQALEMVVHIFAYPFAEIGFAYYGVIWIEASSHGYEGLRGIQIGDSFSSVLDKFPGELPEEPGSDGAYYIYGEPHEESSALLSKLPESEIKTLFFVYEPDGVISVVLRIHIRDELVTSIELYEVY